MKRLSRFGRQWTSFEVQLAGSALPKFDGSGEGWRADPVICPFDFAIVPGGAAEAALAALRSELPGMTPVIFGNPIRAADLIGTIDLATSPNEILRRAASLDLGGWFTERITELQRNAWYAEDGLPPHGEWPAGSAPRTSLCLAMDHSGSISPQIVIGLLPCEDPSAAAAHLRFGGWNACPDPAVHVALAKRWASSHGAMLVASIRDTLEFRVARPITTREDAMEMAMMQYLYNFETVEQSGSIESPAASLVGSSVWQFWWD